MQANKLSDHNTNISGIHTEMVSLKGRTKQSVINVSTAKKTLPIKLVKRDAKSPAAGNFDFAGLAG